jgi:hypothetical protein
MNKLFPEMEKRTFLNTHFAGCKVVVYAYGWLSVFNWENLGSGFFIHSLTHGRVNL